MKETLKNAQIKELYLRKYLKEQGKRKHCWRHYALIGTDKGKWIWANDYLNKQWDFKPGQRYDFYVHSFLKGKDKGKSFLYDYCLAEKPRALKKQFRRQWLYRANLVGKIVKSKPKISQISKH